MENSRSYPTNAIPISLSSGDITLPNVVIFQANKGPHDPPSEPRNSLGLQYQTEISREHTERRIEQAFELVKFYDHFTRERDITRVTAQICNTADSVAMRELPDRCSEVFARRLN